MYIHFTICFQGCESETDSLVQDSCSRIKDGIYSVCNLTCHRHSLATLNRQYTVYIHFTICFQGCESETDSLVQDSCSRIKDGIYSVCKLTGELALATDTHMLYFEDARSDQETQMVSKLVTAFIVSPVSI